MRSAIILCSVIPAVVACLSWRPDARAGQRCYGWIAVESYPDMDALVLLDGKSTGARTPVTLKKVPCGRHRVVATKTDFKAARKRVRVRRGEVIKVRLRIRARYGGLLVHSSPSGATVEVDGRSVGNTPLSLPRMKPGRHRMSLSMADFHPAVRNFRVRRGRQTRVRMDLAPAFGFLRISTRPEEAATVIFDGVPTGTTPLELNRVLPGIHTVRIEHELFYPHQEEVEVVEGQTTEVAAELEANFGILSIATRPAGSRIQIDKWERGRSPLSVRLKPGYHHILALSDDPEVYPARKVVKLRRSRKRQIRLAHRRNMGRLLVDTIPYGSRVVLDGRPVGVAPVMVRKIPVGYHALEASRAGLPSLCGRIKVEKGHTAVAVINLEEPDRSSYLSDGLGTPAHAVWMPTESSESRIGSAGVVTD